MEGQDKEEWRTLHQVMPESVYVRLMVQLRRIGLANGVAVEAFNRDSKFEEAIGPRVQVFELLTILCERTEDEKVFRV